jgi:(S)-2-hydroxyglutarate dehydrogenase
VTAIPLDRSGLGAIEPHARGVAALHVPDAGVVDYRLVCEALVREITGRGGDVVCSTRVGTIDERADAVVVDAPTRTWRSGLVVNCGGLHADQLAERTRAGTGGARIVGFRGEFFDLSPRAEHLVTALIYPVPDDRFPFLGVHLTRTVGGGVHAGPNAVLALAREGYRWRDVDAAELLALARFRGFRRLAAQHWRVGAGEVYRSASKRAFAAAVRRLVPEIGADDLLPAPSGVRAQAVGADGQLVDDFWLTDSARVVNVLNAPSPAATASLEIGRQIVASLTGRLDGD